MMTRRYFPLFLVLLALLSVSSCQKDELSPVPPASQTSLTVLTSLEAAFGTFNANPPEAPTSPAGARALSTPTGHSAVEVDMIVEDGNTYIRTDERKPSSVKSKWARVNKLKFAQRPTIKMLLVLRKAGTTDVSYNYLDWTYYTDDTNGEAQGRYRVVNASVTLPPGATIADRLEGRVLFGGVYDEAAKVIRVPAGLYQEVDLSQDNELKMPIPFASTWSTMNIDNGRLQFVYNSFGSSANQYFTLRPLGILLTTTLRNTSAEAVSVDGLDIQTNALHLGEVAIDPNTGELYTNTVNASATKYTDLSTGDLPTATQVGRYQMPVTGDTFYRMQLNPASPISLPAQGQADYQVAPRVFVLWGMPVEGKSFGAANASRATISFYNYAQTHIYARGVKRADGSAVTRPNYDIVPIMGTDYTFTSGRSYTLNSELFDQPNVLLGYFAKYPLKEDGRTFATTHERSDVDFVNYQTAREFVGDGKELTMPGSTQTARYFVPPTSALTLLGLNAGPAIKTQAGGGTVTYGAYRGQAWPAGVRYEVAGIGHNAQGEIDFGSIDLEQNTHVHGRMYAHRVSDRTVAYAVTNKARVYGANLNRQEQADQTLWRYKLEAGDDLDVRALFVGKYFVGNPYSPIYRGADLLSEDELWAQPAATANQVERYISARGLYNHGPSPTQVDERNFPFYHIAPHRPNIAAYWSVANGFATARVLYWWAKGMYTDETGEQLVQRLLAKTPSPTTPDGQGRYFFGDSEAVFRWQDMPVNSNWNGTAGSLGSFDAVSARARMFLPLLLVSKTYQGDTKD